MKKHTFHLVGLLMATVVGSYFAINTDAVDEVLLKIIDAKQKKFKVIYKEA